MKNIFDAGVTEELIERVNSLSTDTHPQWGKMSVDQMLAHCNVPYEMVYTDKFPKATGLKKWVLRTFLKPIVCGPKPYKRNGRTAPEFVISDKRVFADEKDILLNNLKKTKGHGPSHFNGLESPSFGALTSDEWSVVFYKHLDHHLAQFGA